MKDSKIPLMCEVPRISLISFLKHETKKKINTRIPKKKSETQLQQFNILLSG